MKRQKLENGDGVVDGQDGLASDEETTKYMREVDAGITEYVSREYAGFDCILKYR